MSQRIGSGEARIAIARTRSRMRAIWASSRAAAEGTDAAFSVASESEKFERHVHPTLTNPALSPNKFVTYIY